MSRLQDQYNNFIKEDLKKIRQKIKDLNIKI